MLPVDIRRSITPLDEQMLQYCIVSHLPVLILLTKADKLTRNHANQALFKLKNHLQQAQWANLKLDLILFSAVNGQGEAQARDHICAWLNLN